MMSYTLPSIMDGVGLSASYFPKGSNADSSMAYAISYRCEGLTVNYASGEDNSTAGSESDTTSFNVYAYGPVTVGYSQNEFDGAGSNTNTDQEVTSYEIAYSV